MQADLESLERMLLEAGIASGEDLLRAREESKGLDRFVQSLVGLDREAAKKALDGFLVGRTLNANQIEFIDLVIDTSRNMARWTPRCSTARRLPTSARWASKASSAVRKRRSWLGC